MRAILDLTNNKYGRLIAIRRVGSDKYKISLWLCLCSCGKEKVVKQNRLKQGITQSCGCLAKEKAIERLKKMYRFGSSNSFFGKKHTESAKAKMSEVSKKRIGVKSHNWKGGITPKNQKIRNSEEYKQWRLSVFERDNYSCVLCGNRSSVGNPVTLNADHIKPFAYYPELRLDVNNGRTLCVDCHRNTDTYCGRAYSKYERNTIFTI